MTNNAATLAEQREAFQRRRRCLAHATKMREFARWLRDTSDEGDIKSAITVERAGEWWRQRLSSVARRDEGRTGEAAVSTTIASNAIERDASPITCIVTRGRGGSEYSVGRTPTAIYHRRGPSRVVTSIRPIKEPGQCGYVIWFEVEVDGVLWRRVNGQAVEHVEYALPDVDDPALPLNDEDRLPF